MRRGEGKEPPLRTSILNHSPLETTETRIKSEMAKKVRAKRRTKALRCGETGKDLVNSREVKEGMELFTVSSRVQMSAADP